MEYYTTKEMAEILNVHPSRVIALAHSRGLTKHSWQWVFSEEDIERLRPGKVGNPNVYKSSPNWLKRKNKCRCYFIQTENNEYEFRTQSDEYVCEKCKSLDGKILNFEETGILPLH